MVTRSTMSRTRLFISTGGMTSHRLESVQALRKATSKARASRSSGVSASPMSVLDEKNALSRSSTNASISPEPPPLAAQLEDGQLREPHERLCDIDRRFVHVSERAAFRCDSGERRHWASMM